MFRVIQNNANFNLKSRFTFVRIHEKYLISKLFRRIYQIKNVKIYIHVLENYKKMKDKWIKSKKKIDMIKDKWNKMINQWINEKINDRIKNE